MAVPWAASLFFMPFTALLAVVQCVNLIQSGTWTALTTPGFETYHPLWKPAIFYELAGSVILMFGALILAFLFFRERKIFPRMAIVFVLANSLFTLGDWLLMRSIPLATVQDNLTGSFPSTMGALLWIPYMLRSKRVESTFVN